MEGLDRADQLIRSYYSEHRNVKWTHKLTIYIFNLLVHNSYISFKTDNSRISRTNLEFRTMAIKYFFQ